MTEHTPPGDVAPDLVPAITPPAFADLGLAPELLRAVVESGYTTPTPIQAQAIPLVLSGKDIMGGAQTGTGKTAAFTLPILQRMLPFGSSSPSPARHPVRALILTPTRELALQVFESVKTYSKHTPLRAMCAFGGVDIKPQIAELRKGVEILVATPGRLLDHVEQKTVHFNAVQALVLDEADRMLDMGFIPDIKRILALLPAERQSLLFSATFSEEIKRLADSMLKAPTLVEVARRNQVSETITHRVHPVSEYGKRLLLTRLLKSGEVGQCIVFTRTRQGCSRLARELQRSGIHADAIHGDKSQLERIKTLDGFKSGVITVLVATDVAARGLDIEELPHVINYELPHTPEDYVHRIGRTGRAGRMGNAISLVTASETVYLVQIEALIKKEIEQIVVSGFEPDADYEYPPGAHKKRGAAPPKASPPRPVKAPLAEKPARPERYTPRRSASVPMRAADGFDFSRPYEPATPPVAAQPAPQNTHNPHKPRKIVAALLGGLGRKD
ncbi:MAG: DEAD/DEAH box helicase [Zoogloeaceae bacterium]|jgi:ATP-dependent RNA helicase RhlE|nr:DEAD/DEAH box helicase [Zoogloeaceae bacterium]